MKGKQIEGKNGKKEFKGGMRERALWNRKREDEKGLNWKKWKRKWCYCRPTVQEGKERVYRKKKKGKAEGKKKMKEEPGEQREEQEILVNTTEMFEEVN